MVARPLGEWDVKRVFRPEQGHERMLPNSIGIYSEAPEGEPAGLILEGDNLLLVGEKANFELKGHDQYYNPFEIDENRVNWQGEGIIEIVGGEGTAESSGSIDLTVEYGSLKATLPLKVIGKRDIEVMKFLRDNDSLEVDAEYELGLNLTTSSGKRRNVPFEFVEWQFYGIEADRIEGQNKVRIGSLDEKFKQDGRAGFVIARYEDYGVPYPVITEDFSPTDSSPVIKLTLGEREMEAGEEKMEMDVIPEVINGRTVVPVRFVSEALGSEVLWSREDRRATVIKDKDWIDLWPGDNQMVINGRAQWLDQEPVIRGGRTMLPLRAVGEALDLGVHWESETGNIYLQ